MLGLKLGRLLGLGLAVGDLLGDLVGTVMIPGATPGRPQTVYTPLSWQFCPLILVAVMNGFSQRDLKKEASRAFLSAES